MEVTVSDPHLTWVEENLKSTQLLLEFTRQDLAKARKDKLFWSAGKFYISTKSFEDAKATRETLSRLEKAEAILVQELNSLLAERARCLGIGGVK